MTTEEYEERGRQFRQGVLAFCQMLYRIGNDQTKLATYVFENTWCYMEFDKPKRITLDEFAKGRRRADRSRLNDGCHISQRSNASRGLEALVEKGELLVSTPLRREKARQHRYYMLALPDRNFPDRTVIKSDNSERDTMPLPALTVIKSDNSEDETVIKSDNTPLSNLITHRYQKRLQQQPLRAGDDSPERERKYLEKVLRESTLISEASKTSAKALQPVRLIEIEKEKEENEEEAIPLCAVEWRSVVEKLKPGPGEPKTAWERDFRFSSAFKRGDQFIIQADSDEHKRMLRLKAEEILYHLYPLLPPSMEVFIATKEEIAASQPGRSSA